MNTKMFKLVAILLAIYVLLALFPLNIQKAEATTIPVTRTFSSLTSDGHIRNDGATYSAVHDSETGDVFNTSTSFSIGQSYDFGSYWMWRGFPFFDSSIIPNDANITEVKLSLYFHTFVDSKNLNVTIQSGESTFPHIPLVGDDYYHAHYNGDGGSTNFTDLATSQYHNITFNSQGLGWINKEGITKLCLRSNHDIDSSYSYDSVLVFYPAEQGSAYAPKLYVTYETEGYRYIVHGPYYENGNVANAFVNLTLQIENMASNSTFLNGTDGSADTITFENEQRGIALTWNISAPSFNESRIFTLTDDTFEEIYIYIPNPGETYNLYLINVFDLAGLTDAMLETQINVAGYTRTVERHNLDVSNPMPFYLTWAHSYGLKITSEQGSYTWQITPTSEQTITKIAEKGMFPINIPGQNLTVLVGRMNDTWIQANYTDGETLTTWVNVIVKHRLTGGTWLTDFSFNQTGNTVQVNWYSADSDTDYRVVVQAMRNGSQIEHTAFCPAFAATSNPWENAFTDLFDDLPFPAKNLVGITIVFFFAGIFSVADRVLGALVVIIVAALMTYIGMLDLSWTLIGTVMFIVVLAGLEESKRKQHQ